MNQKGLAPVLIVILIAVLVGVGSLYQRYYKPTVSPGTQQKTQPSSTPAISLKQNYNLPLSPVKEYLAPSLPVVNWKIYTDTNYGWTVQYPADATLAQKDVKEFGGAETNLLYLISIGDVKSTKPQSDGFRGYYLLVGIESKGENISLKDFALKKIQPERNVGAKYPPVKFIREVTINGLRGYQAEDTGAAIELLTYLPYKSSNDKVIVIRAFQTGQYKEQYDKLFDQILSTFKVTN